MKEVPRAGIHTGFKKATVTIAALLAATCAFAQGTSFTYQGQLDDAGLPADGSYDIRFSVWDSSAAGTQLAGPTTFVGVPVDGGLFTVELDFGSAVFNGLDRWLEIGVQTNGGGGFIALTPRTKFTSTPHSIRSRIALIAEGVPAGSIGAAEIANNSVTATDLGPNSVGSSEVIDDSLTAVDLAANSVGSSELAANSVFAAEIATGAVGTSEVADGSLTTADLNLASIDARYVEVAGDTMTDNLILSHVGNNADLYIDNQYPFVFLDASGGNAGLSFENNGIQSGWLYLRASDDVLAMSAGTEGAVENDLTIHPDGRVGVGRVSMTAKFEVQGDVGLHDTDVSIYASDGSQSVLINGDNAGGLYLYNTDGDLRAYTYASSYGYSYLYNSLGSLGMYLSGDSSDGGYAAFYAADGSTTVQIFGESSTAGLIQVNNNTGSPRVKIDGEGYSSSGEIILLDSAGVESTYLRASTAGGRLELNNGGDLLIEETDGTSGISIGGGTGGFMALYQHDGGQGVYVDGDQGTDAGGVIRVYNAAGSARITLDGDVSGDGRIYCDEIQINGGSDLSEQFDIQTDVEPGAVVCIDPENPGKLVVSSKTYDRTVAGIVSGAGGVKPGMMMGQEGTLADGDHPVALTGRVYCKVDASQGAVVPGDLITTSSLPGHGMKVSDHSQAQGAIIGKAMTPLADGQGLVLVLVSLQ